MRPVWRTRERFCVIGALICVLFFLFVRSSFSGVTFDGSSVAHGRTDSLAGPTYTISASMGTQQGTNLFHSFSMFNINTGEQATFTTTGATGPFSNIISRITGGSPSSINGRINSSTPGINLYLMNPYGVVFGPGAVLNVYGSVHVTTADYLRMADGAKFYASLGGSSTLSSAAVTAFGFLSPNPAAISAAGSSLTAPPSSMVSLVGGNLQLTNSGTSYISLGSQHGQVNLISVASPGEVIINQPGAAPSVDVSSFSALGSITESGRTNVSVSGPSNGSLGGGTIIVRAGQFQMMNGFLNANTYGTVSGNTLAEDVAVTGSVLLAQGSQIIAQNMGGGNGGGISVRAGSLQMQETSVIGTATAGAGRGGNITVNVDNNLSLLPFSQISSIAANTGVGGDVNVAARSIYIASDQTSVNAGNFSMISAQTSGPGRGGSVAITADSLQIFGAGAVATNILGPGPGGNINIQANDITLSGRLTATDGTVYGSRIESRLKNTAATGTGGDIAVSGNTLDIVDGAYIGTYLYDGSPGNAGNISVTEKTITVAGKGKIESSSFLGTGNSGNVVVTADQMYMTGIGASDARLDFTGVRSDTNSGIGGNITLTASSGLNLAQGARVTSDSFGSGKGGEIQINSANLLLQQGSIISAKSSAAGNAGGVTLNVGNLQSDHSAINTEAALTDGGNITVNASNNVNLIDSQMTASVGGGPSTVGGNITIDPRYVVLNDSSIIANAYEGKGGNIRITADVFLSSPLSVVSASSQLGINGTVDVRAPVTSITGTLVPVRGTYLQSSEMLRDRCMARLQGAMQSSLTVSGRQGLPPRPGIVLPTPLF